MPAPTRRVVTAKDASGKAIVWIDAPAPIHERPEAGIANTLLWLTDASPAAFTNQADPAARRAGVPPPPSGSVFRIIEIAPEKSITATEQTRLEMMRGLGLAPEGPTKDRPRHPGMHRTRSLDYAIVLSGEIDMLLDDSEVRLTAGDVVVQQGTNHAWVNRGDAPCRVAFILIDAKD